MLSSTVDDTIAAPNTGPLERFLADVTLVAGVAVVELVGDALPALPDDTVSWARVDELGNRVRTLATAPFSRVVRDLGAGALVTCAAFGDHVRALAGPPTPDGRLVLLTMAGEPVPAVWRIVLPAGPGPGGPALLADVAALVERITT